MSLIRFFDKYVELGLKPIAIYQNEKCPVKAGWNKDWSIDKWRPYFHTNDYNMGILLGDIIDVEGDSEEANYLLERMIDGCKRPSFRSSKSTHNLFLNPDPELTRFVFHGIEFRGNLHQSVVPPSTHKDGNKYQWLTGSSFPIPPMPEELQRFYFQNKRLRPRKQKSHPPKPKNREGIIKTVCKTCSNKYPIHRTRLILEVRAFRQYGLLWMCRNCRKIDIRKDCRQIRKDIERQSD